MNVHFLDYIVAFELNRTIIEGKKTITRSRFITLQPSWSLILFCPWLDRKIFPCKERNLISCLKVWAGPAYDLYLWPKCLSNEIPKGTNLFFFFSKADFFWPRWVELLHQRGTSHDEVADLSQFLKLSNQMLICWFIVCILYYTTIMYSL